MLTSNELAVLKRAFRFDDHEFTRGFVYLTEDSISNRIEEVDPSWSFEVLNLTHEGNNAICHARLTIKGVAREGVGMQQILEKAGEPAKGAATDALKRCARLFGVGRYLLNAPKEGDAFKKWLADEQKKSIDLTTGEKVAGTIQPEVPNPTPTPSPAPTPPTTSTAGASAKLKEVNGSDPDVYGELFPLSAVNVVKPDELYSRVAGLFNAKQHFSNWWAQHEEHLLKRTTNEAEDYTRALRWNWDKEKCQALVDLGGDMFQMQTKDILEALSNANGKLIAKWRDWDGGTYNHAEGALLAWFAGYTVANAVEIGTEKALSEASIAAAEIVCEAYQAKETA